MKKELYYAHHKFEYNTPIEQYELDLIKKTFPEYNIVNPNGGIKFRVKEHDGIRMEDCMDMIARQDVTGVAFSSLSGVVSKEVFQEVNHARKLNKKIFYIHDNVITECSVVMFTILNETEKIYAIVAKY